MTDFDYTSLGAAGIARLVATGAVTARTVAEAALACIAATEPTANAFIHLDPEGALAAADAVDAARAAGQTPGPLAGVPVSVKDLVHVAGQPTSFGSRVFAGTPAPEDAVPVARLRAAGAVIVGKTTTPEFGHKAITESPLFGRTLNPWNRAYTSGGSSGGAGASLAFRQVPLAIGTDGGGSIRIPASICGTFGLKATQGRIPHVHAPDLFGNNSFIGPMTRTAADLRLMYAVMAGAEPRDPWSKVLPEETPAEARAGRVGFALLVGNPAIEPQVAAAVEAAVQALERLGLEVEPVEIDLHRHEPHFRAHLETVLAARFGSRLASDREAFDPTFVQTVEQGLARSAVEVQAAVVARTELYRSIEALFGRIDLLVTPTLAAASVPADTDTHADVMIAGRNAGRIRAGWYPYTFPFNLTGHPALSLPCGWTGDGLPIGLQLVGRWYEEERLLTTAELLEKTLAVEARAPLHDKQRSS